MLPRNLLCALTFPLVLHSGSVSAADDWQVSVGGNMQYDWLRTDEADTLAQIGDVRRSRLSLALKAPAGIDAKVEFDAFTNIWTDAFARWRGQGHSLKVGQYKQPMFLDELTSDRYTMFMEQGLPSSFALARRIGAEYAWANPRWRASFSVYDGNLRGQLKGGGGIGRVVYTPFADAGHLLHLAVSAGSESPDQDRARFSSRVEASGIGRTRLDTGTLTDVDRINRTGLEALWIAGPWTLQGEYLRSNVSRTDNADADLDGWYIGASWFASGDHTKYKDGAIEAPELGEDGRAFELAARISSLDLDDGSVRGGNSTNFTLGANWYPNAHVRLTANYVHVDGERRGVPVEPDILEARVMLTF
jgi:phosphate-selective porin OprO/OprP